MFFSGAILRYIIGKVKTHRAILELEILVSRWFDSKNSMRYHKLVWLKDPCEIHWPYIYGT